MDSGVTDHIFLSMHVSGEQLGLYSGIAAALRLLPDFEDIDVQWQVFKMVSCSSQLDNG